MSYTLERDELGRLVFHGPGRQRAVWEPGSGWLALGLLPELIAVRLGDLRDILADIAEAGEQAGEEQQR